MDLAHIPACACPVDLAGTWADGTDGLQVAKIAEGAPEEPGDRESDRGGKAPAYAGRHKREEGARRWPVGSTA